MMRSYTPRARMQPRVLLGLFVVAGLLLLYLPSSSGPTPKAKGSSIWESLSPKGLSKTKALVVDDADSPLVPTDRMTRYVKGISGVTVWENLYFLEGILYAVSSDPIPVPARSIIAGLPTDQRGRYGDPEEVFKTISPQEASGILGRTVIKKDGLTMFFNDRDTFSGPGMISHYYHWAEVFISGWRLLAAAYGRAEIPKHILFRELPAKWRDHAGLNAWILMMALPSTDIAEGSMFTDMVNSKIGYVFERIVIVDRVGCHAWAGEPAKWNKMSANLPSVDAPHDWWAPMRNSFKRFLISQGCEPPRVKSNVPVVTYINRQATERRLTNASHDSLVEALNQLEAEGVIELANHQMEFVERTKQFCQVLRTDILIGVHGNGMSHQLWMRPGSGLIEFMNPPGFAMDYALPAKIMNHQYFAIHNDTVFTEAQWQDEKGRPVLQGPTFHSKTIPVHGPFISDLVRSLACDLSAVPDEW